eukprot:m.55783 g.55783  ORF g.55783 m.55783 type:complete len:444 (+) comp11002_c0_seq4:1141-2472(+)
MGSRKSISGNFVAMLGCSSTLRRPRSSNSFNSSKSFFCSSVSCAEARARQQRPTTTTADVIDAMFVLGVLVYVIRACLRYVSGAVINIRETHMCTTPPHNNNNCGTQQKSPVTMAALRAVVFCTILVLPSWAQDCSVDVGKLQATVSSLSSTVATMQSQASTRFDNEVSTLLSSFDNVVSTSANKSADVAKIMLAPHSQKISDILKKISSLEDTLSKATGSGSVVDQQLANKLDTYSKKIAALETGNTNANKDTDKKISDFKTALDKKLAPVQRESHFYQYGHRTCPTGTAKWFDGATYGAHHGHSGTGEVECLKLAGGSNGGISTGHNSLDLLYPHAADHVTGTTIQRSRLIPCAYCISKVPCFYHVGEAECPPDYDVKFTGWMFGSHHGHRSATTRICIRDDTEYTLGGGNSHWLYASVIEAESAIRSSRKSLRCAMCCKK